MPHVDSPNQDGVCDPGKVLTKYESKWESVMVMVTVGLLGVMDLFPSFLSSLNYKQPFDTK